MGTAGRPGLSRRRPAARGGGRPRGLDDLRRRSLWGLTLVLAPVLVSLLAGAADARDNGRNIRANEIEQRMREIQAELERQRRDMQRQQQEAMKAAEEARRQAEREMQRQREAMEREMRREQERLMREAERERERAMREAQQEQERARREQERSARAAEDAARKAVEQAQKAAEAQQRRLAEEQARRNGRAANPNLAGVWREDIKGSEPDAATAGLKQFESEQRRLDEEARKADERLRQRAARAKGKAPGGGDARAAASRGAKGLPSRLPSAAANARAPHRWDKKGASLAPMPRGRATTANAKGPAAGRPVAPAVPRAVSYPGKEKGAEMPPDLFAKAREQEFVVPALTPEDLARAKQHGFELSTPVEIGERGTRMQRLRAPGFVGNEAERELHKALPFLSVTPNYAYSIFIGALGEAEPGRPSSRKPVVASQAPCPQAVCFGERFIDWTGEARACAGAAKIGIIDTSFDTGHPAFANLRFESREFLDGARSSPYDWHGTAVLSVLAGNPTAGTPGLAPGATYYLATAFRSDAAGNASTDTMRLLAALAWLEEQDVDVVNMSFAGPRDPAVAAAIQRLSKKGVVSVAAVGNMGPNAPPSYPAAYPQVIAVTAVNRQGNSYRNANRGPHVDVSAPGVDILTALPRKQQGLKSGTSFAAPFVTAIVATHGDMAFTGAKSQVLAHVKTRDLGPPGRDPIYGAGLALAPRACGGGKVAGGGAKGRPSAAAASTPSWTNSTTLMRAGAGP